MTEQKHYLIALKILKNLEKKVVTFPLRRQFHFCERIYRITGRKKYLPPIKKFLLSSAKDFFLQVKFLGNHEKEKLFGLKITKWLSASSLLKQKRWQYYNCYPELKFYQFLTFSLKKFNEYQVSSVLKTSDYQMAISKLKEINWEKYLLDNEFLFLDPVQGVNQVFWLKKLKITNLISPFISKLKSIYPPISNPWSSHLQIHNLFYSYTHLIIAESDYYQKFVSPKKYHWVLVFLKREAENIFKLGNLDLIAEIGCCFKLVKKEKKMIKKIKSLLVKNFNPKIGLINLPNKKPTLIEHANTLAILVLKKWKKLYPAPKIYI